MDYILPNAYKGNTHEWLRNVLFTAQQHCLQCRALKYLQQFRLSVRPSQAGTLSRRMKEGSCDLHFEVAKTL